MQRVDTLAKKVGADVKHAEGVEKAKLNAEAQKVGAAVKKAETTEKQSSTQTSRELRQTLLRTRRR